MKPEIGPRDTQQYQQEQKTGAWKAHLLAFAREIKASASDEEKMSLDESAGPEGLVEDVISFVIQEPERFKPQLTDLIKTLHIATGHILACEELQGGLVLSAEGEIGVTRGESFRLMHAPLGQEEFVAKRDEMLYEILTGPRKGETVSSKEAPLWTSGLLPGQSAEA